MKLHFGAVVDFSRGQTPMQTEFTVTAATGLDDVLAHF